jgi:general stress protein 26
VRAQRDGVVSTVGPDGAPQAAFLSIAATDHGELVFDARPDSRKVANIRRDPRVAAVVGGPDGTTLQCQGIADVPEGRELDRCAAAYVSTFPEFEQSLRDGVIVIRVTLNWARYGDFRGGGHSSHDVELA